MTAGDEKKRATRRPNRGSVQPDCVKLASRVYWEAEGILEMLDRPHAFEGGGLTCLMKMLDFHLWSNSNRRKYANRRRDSLTGAAKWTDRRRLAYS